MKVTQNQIDNFQEKMMIFSSKALLEKKQTK